MTSAKATMVDGPLTLTLLFRFNDAGLIGSFRAEARGGMVGKKMVMAPWEGAGRTIRRERHARALHGRSGMDAARRAQAVFSARSRR